MRARAGLDDPVVLGRGLRIELRDDPLPVGTGDPVEVVQVEEVDELRVVNELRLFLRQPLGYLLGERLLS